ncbi:hypothetical protein MKQ70_00505 [Chitinophaga sedimenti]|uniref:hypothetical protein n=1 Tax=Chitinophaga sedimenti TaxID=2033606 RepID=UPI0020030509|nr:hypothetical protein [Chitinophaga sedimenti]MCK7553563.1 hypothetical protein [Chitinophaga sedimenti]
MNKLKFAMPLAIAALFCACKKEKDDPKTNEEKLLGSWTYVSITADRPVIWNDGDTPTKDGLAHLPTCVKDDYIVLKANNVSEQNEGATKCDPDDDQVITSDWSLDGTKLIIDGEEYKLITVNGSTFKASTTGEYEGEEVTITLTLKRK